ncbi:uncharacterized protein UV8b_03701 [Ustilaginoidea virens]|uniref:Uncharacterized protein n=1 Tax=Ustilaginoidea virens TaxID=1159556 RepID=A0A063BWT0_USTVR|nr:uncharacterized protein UV8b_03701 [Ustilaginoidea virens]QUC19460.1 hypothetical protein UV8b_03701 [Ustilaginoidea virens]GAO13283.1 hypothetical protein UVI_02026280 [Ustilaginoidea virens]
MAPVGLLIATGTLAVLATSVTIVLEIICCIGATDNSLLLAAGVLAAALESVILLVFGTLGIVYILKAKIPLAWKCSKLVFILQLTACAVAAIASIVALVSLQKSIPDTLDGGLADQRRNIAIGLTVALTMAAVSQLGFVVFCLLTSRGMTVQGSASTWSSHSTDDGRKHYVKAIRYSQTSPMNNAEENTSGSKTDSPARYNQRSSFRITGMPHLFGPTSSGCRLLIPDDQRPISLESVLPRASTDTSFDSWDTSSVDTHHRQAVIDVASASPSSALKNALETNPANPPRSRPPSRPPTPFDLADLEPPRILRRMDSCGSSLSHSELKAAMTPNGSISELHIHPLFRSDSPTPPPAASPGTVVVAAPNAGQVISRRGSLQSLRRLRSGSLPTRSPLSLQASMESLGKGKTRENGEAEADRWSDRSDKNKTPPVPEWLLSSSMKASLETYKERVVSDANGEAGEAPG